MAEDDQHQPALTPVERHLSLIPVGIKEAALDSPTFRATTVHFGDQIDLVERWLDGYVRSASKLSYEASSLESLVNSFLSHAAPPQQASEAILDQDYTILAIQRYGECAREFWSNTVRGIKRVESSVVEPIRAFLSNDIRNLKDVRKTLEHAQKNFDTVISRYAGQTKSKEASSLREDAFQLHEARKIYLKASMDFCVTAPQVRASLDKVLVKVFTDQWRDMRNSREVTTSTLNKWGPEMDRVRGWSREMENGERVFKRELQMARRQIEETAEHAIRPSRELDDYSISTVAYLASQPTSAKPRSPANTGVEKSEKQGWLFQRIVYGKPTRTVWTRRWYFVKNGIFGWLANGARSGAVEESEKTGVLLCNIRAAFQEERRFCLEVKTKDTSILLQAETQAELTEWISAFEVAKRKALEDPGSTEHGEYQAGDMAFAISPPVAPEFTAKSMDTHASHGGDEVLNFDRVATLSLPERDGMGNLASRSSSDVTKRTAPQERETERTRDKIIEKLDLHRKSTAPTQAAAPPLPSLSGSGIASLISASHTVLPVGPGGPSPPPDARASMTGPMRSSTLAPSTLANPPTPTNLSKAAVILSGERGVSLGRGEGGMPGGLLANLWGSSNWGHINRLERGEVKSTQAQPVSRSPSPSLRSSTPPAEAPTQSQDIRTEAQAASPATSIATSLAHRKTNSLGTGTPVQTSRQPPAGDEFPNYYPLPLKAQDAQFRVLFPTVPREEKVVLVFRATWNPNEQQEFPGRVYVTVNEIYFYSHHLGLVLITGVHLSVIEEVTAAPGRDCDFLYLHLVPGNKVDGYSRITIKVFLEPLKLLQRRLNFLVRNSKSGSPLAIEEVLKNLIKMEAHGADVSPDPDSWEDVSLNTPVDGAPDRREQDMKASLRIDGELFATKPGKTISKNATKFKLPSQAVDYAPSGMTQVAIEKEFDVSAKALFHVLFGDKSAVFQLLYCERWASRVTQHPWSLPEQGRHKREFAVELPRDFDRSQQTRVIDSQVIDVLNDHLCYVVTDRRVPFYLPSSGSFLLISKIVITHTAKSRSKLAIYNKIEWARSPLLIKGLVEEKALNDLRLDASDLVDVTFGQVQKLGSNSRTKKSTQIFGQVGQQSQTIQCTAADLVTPATERKLQVRPITSFGLLLGAAQALAVDNLFALLSGVINAVSGLAEILSAHAVIIGILLLSGSLNLFYTSKDAKIWWEERGAQRYMTKLGVGPDTRMSRAVYLQDLDEILRNQSLNNGGYRDGGACRSTFKDLIVQTDLNAPVESSPTFFSEASTKATARRLRHTRQHMGAYRHDLLVAMRVVNSIERETVEAEWDNWLLDENFKCNRVGQLLKNTNLTSGTHRGVEDWYHDYCTSCRAEQERRRVMLI